MSSRKLRCLIAGVALGILVVPAAHAVPAEPGSAPSIGCPMIQDLARALWRSFADLLQQAAEESSLLPVGGAPPEGPGIDPHGSKSG